MSTKGKEKCPKCGGVTSPVSLVKHDIYECVECGHKFNIYEFGVVTKRRE